MKNKTLKNIIVLESIGSTNNYAIEFIKKFKPEEGSLILTNKQDNGKGQNGKSWESEPGKNLTFSIILYPDFIPVDKQFILSKAVSLALTDLLEKYTSDIKIKWPNDIYYKNLKIAGILIENSIKKNKIMYSVVGIGLNCNQENFSKKLPNPVSLKNILKKDLDLHDLLFDLKICLLDRYNEIKKVVNKIDADYLQKLYRVNIESEFIGNAENICGTIKGVDEWGKLQVYLKNGQLKTFDFGEIEFVNDKNEQ